VTEWILAIAVAVGAALVDGRRALEYLILVRT
jgi:hypothetical protein